MRYVARLTLVLVIFPVGTAIATCEGVTRATIRIGGLVKSVTRSTIERSRISRLAVMARLGDRHGGRKAGAHRAWIR